MTVFLSHITVLLSLMTVLFPHCCLITYITFLMIVFLRHAERGDNELPMQLSEIPHDPPIITASKETIRKTSEELIQLFR